MRLKILLLFSILLFIFLTSHYTSIYNKTDNSIKGIITDVTKKENYTELIVKNKEKILIKYYNDNCNYKLGDYIQVNGNLIKPNSNTNFNTFNYKQYLLSKKIYWI